MKEIAGCQKRSISSQSNAKSIKYNNAMTYINYCAEILNFGDSSATHKDVIYLPYETSSAFYEEYVAYFDTKYSPLSREMEMAGKDTFDKVLNDLHDKVRLSHAKGNLCFLLQVFFY